MSNVTYQPGVGNLPFGNQNANPQGSNYQADSQYSPTETNLLAKVVKRQIFDAAPKQYAALKILFQKSPRVVPSDEFEYVEKTFARSPLTAAGGAAAVVAVPGASVTQTFNLAAASLDRVSEDLVITYPDGTEGVIIDVTGAAVTVRSRPGVGLSAVTANDIFAIRSTIMADAMDYYSVYMRTETITRYNYIQFFKRARRWGKVELLKYQNTGTTDFLKHDLEDAVNQIRVDMFVSMFNGHKGEYTISGGHVAKSMGGIYPQMIAAGAASANVTLAGFQSAFESLAFNTNYKQVGETRFIYGTHEMLHNFSKIYKLPNVEYSPNDEVANLKLQKIEIGGQSFVMVPCELFREPSCFPSDWSKRIFVLDQETISPVIMQGLPMVDSGETLTQGKNGSRENYKDFWMEAQLSIEFNNPVASFIIDVQ
jgi:hypothetical protein